MLVNTSVVNLKGMKLPPIGFKRFGLEEVKLLPNMSFGVDSSDILSKMGHLDIAVRRIAEIRGVEYDSKYSSMRSAVFTLICTIDGRFQAVVLGDDTGDVPVYIENYVKDAEDERFLVAQEYLLVKWMRKQDNEIRMALDRFRGKSAILSISKIGYYGQIEGDNIVFRDFGVFGDEKMQMISELI